MDKPPNTDAKDDLMSDLACLPKLSETEREAVAERIAALGSRAFPILDEMLSPDRPPIYTHLAIRAYARLGDAAVPTLSRLFDGDDAEVLALAAQALAEIGTRDASLALGDAGRAEALATPTRAAIGRVVAFWAVVISIAGAYFAYTLVGPTSGGAAALLTAVGLLALLLPLAVSPAHRREPGRLAAITGLARVAGAADLDPLARCLGDRDPRVRATAADALVPLLADVTTADRDRLSPDGAAALAWALEQDEDEELGVALVRTLAMLGRADALPPIEHIACDPQEGGSLFESVRETARGLLPGMRARIARERAGGRLVRAAAGEAGASLVRPAAAGGGGETEQLVRPAHGSGDGATDGAGMPDVGRR